MKELTLEKRDIGIACGLVMLIFLVYSGAVHNGFLANWDDNLYITANPDIQAVTWGNVRHIFSHFYVGNYAPLHLLSYMVDYRLWGPNPKAFLLHNIFLHGINAGLVYFLLRRLRLATTPALLGALVFALHPVQVESVAWISQRKNLLSMALVLATLLLYLHGTRSDSESRRRWWLVAANLTFVLALLAKSAAVVVPPILLAYDLLLRQERRPLQGYLLEKLPFALSALACCAVTLVSQNPQYGGYGQGGIVATYHGGSGYATFLTMLTVYRDYLANIAWPLHLSAFYDPAVKTGWDGAVVGSLLLLVATLAIPFAFHGERRRLAGFGVATFLIALLPVSQIVPLVTLMNDRYLYYPILGLAVLVAALAAGVGRPRFLLLITLPLGIALACGSFQRARVWHDAVTLWQDATQKQPQSYMTWRMLGHARHQAGDDRRAIPDYLQAIRLYDQDPLLFYDTALAYQDLGEKQRAIEDYRQALAIDPDYADARYNLGLLYFKTGDYRQAQATLQQALQRKPNAWDLYLLLGHVAYLQEDGAMARLYYRRAAELNDSSPYPWNFLALVEERAGHGQLAARYLKQALDRGGNRADLYLNRARLETIGHHRELARADLRQARAAGLTDLETLLAKDPDLQGLWEEN